MVAPRAGHRRWPGGLVGTYALHLMSRAPIYGGELTQRIDDVTRGAWRPGAGAIYPILTGLVQRGEARVDRVNGRKTYTLTPRGAARLAEVQSRIRDRGSRFAELRSLVLDMVDPPERAEIMLDNLHRAIDAIAEIAASPESLPDARARTRILSRARAELRRGVTRLGPSRGQSPARRRSR
jgi:DNA-binding PadR family transcriptional regulator